MINTNLIDILRTFSVEETKKFGEMINSPFFNKQTPLIKLFDHIKIYYPEFKNDGLRKETVYLKMFPDKKYNYGSMKNLIYDLQKLSEEFIAYQEMKSNKFEIKKSLIKSLRSRKLNSLSEKNLKELEKGTSGKEIIDRDYFLKLYYINNLKQSHIFDSSKGNLNITEKIQTPYFEQYVNSTKYLKKYFLIDTLRSFNRVITNKNILNTNRTMKDIELFINSYSEADFEEISLKLELNFLKMNLGKITENEFLQFKKLVLTDLYELKADKNITYAYSIYLLNYCRIKNKTDKQYRIHAFEILKSLADNKNLDSESGFMSIILARNIIIISTQLSEFEWCENFLELNLEKIHPDYRDNLMKFYFAHKNLYIGMFEKSLEYLSTIKFDDIFNKNYIKELQVINYYELKYFDLLNEQLDSYKKFLTNNERLPDTYKTQCIKFVNYMYKLFKAYSGSKSDLLYLKKNIINEKELLFKEWFINKLDELSPKESGKR